MKTYAKLIVTIFAFLMLAGMAYAADGSSLKPPSGAKVAVVVFEDLECPLCARAYPLIWQAANAAHVPVVLHDFPLSKHPWSFQAAVYARFFDTKSQKLGDDFRGYIYQNQPAITPGNLLQYVQKFADDNHVPLPFAVDPEAKLKEKIQADYALGLKCALSGTPTIFVVGRGNPSFIQVSDLDSISQTIETMQKTSAKAASAGRKTAHKPAHKALR
jgi:protein-disulfide isomerase